MTFSVIFAGLIGAIVWDLITWYYGLPTSSSHALIGGYAGAAWPRPGFGAIILSGWTKTLIFIVLAPLIGMVLGVRDRWSAISVDLPGHARRAASTVVPTPPARVGGRLTASVHGGNDAQKTMGIIAGALVAGGYLIW